MIGDPLATIKTYTDIKPITMEEFISVGMVLREKKDGINWELGDLADDFTKEFGPKELTKFSKGIGIQVGTLKRYRDIARAYEPEIREEFKALSWTHFRLLAAHENRINLLKMAVDNEWSVEKLAVMMKGQTPIPMAVPLSDMPPAMEKCAECGGWRFIDKEVKLCPDDGRCDYLKNLAN